MRLAPVPLPPAHAELAAREPRAPDQGRYGPREPLEGLPAERVGTFLYVNEGRTPDMDPGELGWSVTCRCGWLTWTPSLEATRRQALGRTKTDAHKCKHTREESPDAPDAR